MKQHRGEQLNSSPECGLTTLETRRLRGDQIEVFKILNGYENIDPIIIFLEIKERKQSRLYVKKYSILQMTINVWNKLSTDCVHASSCSVHVCMNTIDYNVLTGIAVIAATRYFARARESFRDD